MKKYNLTLSILKEVDDKTKKNKHHLRNATLAGVSGFAASGLLPQGAMKQEKNKMKLAFVEVENELYDKRGIKGLEEWKKFKQTKAYQRACGKAFSNILRRGTVAAAISILLYSFYAFVKEYQLKKYTDFVSSSSLAK